jgi:hypothetical protein
MTHEEILAMKPGRELDCLVAEKFFGYKVEWLPNPRHPHEHGKNVAIEPMTCSPPHLFKGWWCPTYWEIPHYSTDIAVAWQVVEKMQERDWMGVMISPAMGHGWKGWAVNFGGDDSLVYGETLPEAVCKAALLAVMGSDA